MQQQPNESLWNTCYNANGINACAKFWAGIDPLGSDHPDAPWYVKEPNQFVGGWGSNDFPLLINGTQGFRITAWSLQWPTPATMDMWYTDDAIIAGSDLPYDYAPHGFGAWAGAGFTDINQYLLWDFAVGGPHYEAAHMQGIWLDGVVPSLTGTRLAWRGESEDHSLVFDCIQAEAGSTQCIGNDALSVTTTTPEPGTLALLLTGLALVALARRMMR